MCLCCAENAVMPFSVSSAAIVTNSRVSDSQQSVKYVIKAITGRYSFLWVDDARRNFAEILEHDGPQGALNAVKRETERLIVIEQEIVALPQTYTIGAVCLYMQPVRETLIGLALAWKNLYTSALLERAQVWRHPVMRCFDTWVGYFIHDTCHVPRHCFQQRLQFVEYFL
jgi:hypothetical protein